MYNILVPDVYMLVILVLVPDLGDTGCSVKNEMISCDYRNLTQMPDFGRVDLNTITILDMSNNQLETLGEDDFMKFTGLRELRLHTNMLSNLEDDVFMHCINLENLTLTNNRLTNLTAGVFKGLYKLKYLIMNENLLSSLDATLFYSLFYLQMLKLTNKISTIPLKTFDTSQNLENLSLSDNKLSKIEIGTFSSFTNLQTLSLSDNKLSKIELGTFDSLTDLQTLSLSENKLSKIEIGTFDSLSALQTLQLNNNALSMIAIGLFDALIHLRQLSPSDNKLLKIEIGTFDSLKNLQTLSLSDNKLSKIEIGIFDSLTALQTLSLSDNKLLTIEIGIFDSLTTLQTLILPLICDCDNSQQMILPFIQSASYEVKIVLRNQDITTTWINLVTDCKSPVIDLSYCKNSTLRESTTIDSAFTNEGQTEEEYDGQCTSDCDEEKECGETSWDYSYEALRSNELQEQLKVEIDTVKKHLGLERQKTNAFIRRRTSASDSRTSSFVMGCISTSVILVPFVLAFCSDLTRRRIPQKIIRKRKKHKKKLSPNQVDTAVKIPEF